MNDLPPTIINTTGIKESAFPVQPTTEVCQVVVNKAEMTLKAKYLHTGQLLGVGAGETTAILSTLSVPLRDVS